MNKERQRNEIIEELYLTGRYKGLYMGKPAKSKQNPLKKYIQNWLENKAIKQDNMLEHIDNFYQELFLHISKIPTDTLIELAENPTKLTATACLIVKRQLFSQNHKPAYNQTIKLLKKEHRVFNINEELNKDYSFFELQSFNNLNKKALDEALNDLKDKEQQLLYLLSYARYYKNNIKTKPTSFFEQVFENMPSDLDAWEIGYKIKDETSTEFSDDYGIDVNDILEQLTDDELLMFSLLANNNTTNKKLSIEIETIETAVFNAVNKIKFNK